MVEFDPDWWKRIFDETYLITDARSVCDDELTCKEVDFLEEILQMERSWPILIFVVDKGAIPWNSLAEALRM